MECCLKTSNYCTIKSWTALKFFIWNLDNVVVTLFSNIIHEQNTSNTNLTHKAYPGYCKHVLCWRPPEKALAYLAATTCSGSKCELVVWMFYRYCDMNVYEYANYVHAFCEKYFFNLSYCTCMIWFMTVWCRYNEINFVQNPQNRHPIAPREGSLVILTSDSPSATVFAVPYIRPW